MFNFIIGMLVGSLFGVVVMALCNAAREGERND